MRARVWTAVAAAATALLVSSCAAVDVNDIPAPGMSYDDGYDVVMQFASALNLPDRAKVVLVASPSVSSPGWR